MVGLGVTNANTLSLPLPGEPERILILSTSNEKLGDTDQRTGAWAESIAAPYYLFQNKGYDIVFGSVRGGKVPLDPLSIKGPYLRSSLVRRMLEDDILLDRLNNTACVVFLDGRDFDAMLITDGHGIMWDGAYNSEIIRLVKEMYSSGKVLAAIGHGVGPLASVPVPDKANGYTHGFTNGYANGYTDTYSGRRQKYNGTRYIVTDKQVTASTNSEEAALGRSNLVPFLLESKLAKNGAAFTKGGDFRPYAVRAGQLVTGQNYASSRMVAECMVEALSLGVRMLSD